MEGMDSIGEFLVKNAVSSSDTVATATADSDASEGSYTLTVSQLAKGEVELGNTSISDPNSSLTASAAVFSFSYGTASPTQFDIDVPADTTLTTLAALINKAPGNDSVRAEVLQVAGGDYRLKLSGLDLGQDNTISIEAATTLTGFTAADFTQKQGAQSALFNIDGIDLSRDTNSVDNAVAGLTLTLRDTGTTQISVTNDTDAIKKNVHAFVDQINEVRTKIQELTAYDETTKQAAILNGNNTISMIEQSLKEITANSGLGFDPDNDPYSVLAQIGIKTDVEDGSATYGLLVIDGTELAKALEDNPQAVAELFSADYQGESDTASFTYISSISGTTEPGNYTVEYTVSGGSVTGTIGGYAANFDSASGQMTGAAETPVAGMAIQVNDLTDGVHSGNLQLKLGKTGEFINELQALTSVDSGPLNIMEESYQDSMDSIDDKVLFEEKRLTRLERDLKNRFARLDAMLAHYQGVSASLQSQLVGLMQR